MAVVAVFFFIVLLAVCFCSSCRSGCDSGGAIVLLPLNAKIADFN